MHDRPPRVLAIHDMSGVGRCSLTVILPVLSAMGIQVCPVPTALLSTHTGGFGEVEFVDLTSYMHPTLEHYQRLGLSAECVYSGFLGSHEQIDLCDEYMLAYPDALKVVDPVLGDHGKPYRTVTREQCEGMRDLVRHADIITPNLTEAYILLDEPYADHALSRDEYKELLTRLSDLGPRCVVVTGVHVDEWHRLNIGCDRERGEFFAAPVDFLPVSFPGTGDMFAAILTGSILRGDSLPTGMARASRFIERAIRATPTDGAIDGYLRQGVMFEKVLTHILSDDGTDRFEGL